MDLLERIRALYPTFNKTRKRISDGILAAPAQCCFLSLKEFAAAMDVTETTILNYCKALGLGSYVELKKELQAHMLNAVGPGDRLKMAANRSGSAAALYQEVIKQERDALRATFEYNSLDKVLAFNRCIHGAKRVFVAAHNASRIPGLHLERRLLPLGVDISLLNLEDKHLIFSCLTALPAKDCLVIAVAVPTYGQSTLNVVDYCHKVGIPVAAITDRESSPVARGAAATLVCRTDLMGLTNSSTSMLAVINLASMLYSFEREEREPEETARIAALAEQFEAYFPE